MPQQQPGPDQPHPTLTLIALASMSLQENTLRAQHRIAAETAGLAADGSADPVSQAVLRRRHEALKSLSAELEGLAGAPTTPAALAKILETAWPSTQGQDVPFSEISPLTDPKGKWASVRIVILGHRPTNPLLALMAPDNGEASVLAPYLCTVLQPPGTISIDFRDLGVATDNTPATVGQLQSAVMDVAAGIAQEAATTGASPQIWVNGIAGANVGVEALVWSAAVFGWKVAYPAGVVTDAPAPVDLSPGAVGDRWGRALRIVSDTRAATVTERLTRAAHQGVLPYVTVREQGLGMSRMGRRLVDIANRPRPAHSSTVAVLDRHGTDEASSAAERLRILVETWSSSDPFGGNLVHELVLHGMSHCEAVDRNVASLSEPLLDAGLLTPADVFDMAAAAWLHDWGHSGAVLVDESALARIHLPQHLRRYHGPISALRIETYPSITGLGQSDAQRVKLICAHHQGWSSISDFTPRLAPPLTTGPRPPGTDSLWNDWTSWTTQWHATGATLGTPGPECDHDAGYCAQAGADQPHLRQNRPAATSCAAMAAFGRLQLLVALFRVADAADIGIHRVPLRDGSAQRERLLDEARLGILTQTTDEQERRTLLDYARERIINRSSQGIANDDLHEWVDHCAGAVDYYRLHSLITGAYLHIEPTDTGPWRIVPHVYPGSDEPSPLAEALFRVTADIKRELGQTPSQGLENAAAHVRNRPEHLDHLCWNQHPDDKEKQLVKAILDGHRIVIGEAQRI